MASAVVFSLLAFLIVCTLYAQAARYPVILVPGDGGSQLFAKLDRAEVPHFYCSKQTDYWFNIWLNIEEFSVPIDCFVDNMRLRYNATTRTTHNAKGVDIRIDGFGETRTVEWLDPDAYIHRITSYSHVVPVAYFFELVESLVTIGYTRDKDIKGAPYDFRRAPNELGEFYANLTKLVEATYSENGDQPVVMVAHSMGNPVMLYFYNQQKQAWKDKYLRAHISLAGVWAGAVKPVRLMTSGDALGVYVVSPSVVRPEQRAMPSTAWLMPSTKFWNDTEILVYTEHRNYTSNDYQQFFADMNYTDGYSLWEDTHELIIDLKAPGVETHCLFGSGLPTPGAIKFAPNGFPDKYPETIPDDGDGTVNKRSLMAFAAWASQQKQPVKYAVLKGAEHMAILSDPRAHKYILDFLDPKPHS